MKIVRKAWSLTAGMVDLTEQLKSENGKLVGAVAFYFNDYLERFNLNVTFKPYDSLGHFDKVTGQYTGVIGGLQANETDFVMTPLELTSLSPDQEPPVDFGPPALHSDLFITSIPLSKEVQVGSTVMDIFLCLEPDAGTLVFIALLLFWLLFKYVARLDNVWMRLYACLFNQDSFETHRSAHKWLTALYVLAVFWFMQYFTSFISTDMTVAAPAKVIDSIHDLFLAYRKRKPQVLPVILEGLNIELMINQSKERSARQVLDIIQKNRSASVYPMEQMSIIQILQAIYEKRAAWIIDKAFLKGSQFACCASMNVTEAHKYRKSKDRILPTSPYYAYSKGLPLELKAQLDDMNFRLLEYGLNQDLHETRSTYLTDFYKNAEPAQKLCLETFDTLKDVEAEDVFPFGLVYVVFAFYLFCGGAILATIMLTSVEPVYFSVKRRKKALKGRRMVRVKRVKHATWSQVKLISAKLNQ